MAGAPPSGYMSGALRAGGRHPRPVGGGFPRAVARRERITIRPAGGGGARRRFLFSMGWGVRDHGGRNGTEMANTKSAKKAARKIARRTEINKARRSRMRTFVRKVEEAIASGNRES